MITTSPPGRKGLIPFFMAPLLALLIVSAATGAELEKLPDRLPVPGTVTLIELGAENCLPCRLLAPIIADLQKEYQGKAAIFHIDVYRQREAAMKFHALVTPTLIYFDRQGHEAAKHAGFQDKADIIAELDKLLARQE